MIGSLASLLIPLLALQAPCGDWSPSFPAPGVEGSVTASAVYDDGSGPALYVAGPFAAAGEVAAQGIARWDGSQWSPLGGGLKGDINALEVYDDGSGPALYVGGNITFLDGQFVNKRLVTWDGSSWGNPAYQFFNEVHALLAAPTPNGERLFVGASGFLGAFDGPTFSVLPGLSAEVLSLALFDDRLYVGGRFGYAANQPAEGLAIWNFDGTWSVLPELLNHNPSCNCIVSVSALCTYDDGNGEALYAAGFFDNAGSLPANEIARWDGQAWSAVGGGIYGSAYYWPLDDMIVFDDGTGSKLVLVGRSLSAGSLSQEGLLTWDGVSWSTLGTGLEGVNGGYNIGQTLTVYDDGTGPGLYVGGRYQIAGGTDAYGIARWDGAWSAVGTSGEFLDAPVRALVEHDDGSGPALYVGGDFRWSSTGQLRNVGRWTGATWEQLLGGVFQAQGGGGVYAMATFDAGSGRELYVGGEINTSNAPLSNFARWDGAQWHSPGGGVSHGQSTVRALVEHDDGSGPALFLGGAFRRAGGVAGFERVARWDGSAWSQLAAGMDDEVRALAVFDYGSGPMLFAGGEFTTAGGSPAPGIARWADGSWSGVSGGLPGGVVNTLVVHDDGSGEALYAGGLFSVPGSPAAQNVARWRGQWEPVDAGLPGEVHVLASVADGLATVPSLYAGGDFDDHLARWNGLQWTTVDTGTTQAVRAILRHDDGQGAGVFVGGDFTGAGGVGSARIAKLTPGCGCEPSFFCDPGLSASGCLPQIAISGVASASATSGFDLSVTGMEGGKSGLFFYGTNGRQENPWGNGTSSVCVAPPRWRGALMTSSGASGTCDGQLSEDLNARWCTSCPKPNHNPGPGAHVQAQVWYRDPLSTSNQDTSLSGAVEFLVCP